MPDVEHSRGRQGELWLAAVGLLATLLVGCSRVDNVEVRATAPGMASNPANLPPSPILAAERHERHVVVGAATRWVPRNVGVSLLQAGDDVQVKAQAEANGTWLAAEVILLDVD